MNAYRALVATAVQMLLVSVVFAVMLTLPLSDTFFRQHGVLVGPGTWVVCSLVTGGILRLSLMRSALGALVSGLVLAVAALAAGHIAGMVAGAIVFGLTVATRTGRAEEVGAAGIEPAFSGLKGRRPNH